ncbi:hypothetical protein VTI74DRAFT_2199 [Chaetomium olivicolor]
MARLTRFLHRIGKRLSHVLELLHGFLAAKTVMGAQFRGVTRSSGPTDINPAEDKNRFGSQWCESYVVKHLSGHYLLHQLQDNFVKSRSLVMVDSAGPIRRVEAPSIIEGQMKAGSGAEGSTTYSNAKSAQLLGAH